MARPLEEPKQQDRDERGARSHGWARPNLGPRGEGLARGMLPAMTPEIRPTTADDLDELSRFLTEGFHAPRDAEFAAPDVLAWKYLEPIGRDATPRSLVAVEGGRVVGHVGIYATSFEGGGLPDGGVTTLHMIDWLGSREHRSLGSSLMRKAHEQGETQFVLVANEQARRVTKAAGYASRGDIPVFRKVLRPSHRLRAPGQGGVGKVLRMANDLASIALKPGRRPESRVVLRRVEAFGDEVGPIVNAVRRRAAMSSRAPDRLNHMLKYPREGMSGWQILDEPGGRVVGLAILNVVRQDRIQAGKVVECLLEDASPAPWHAAAMALAAELRTQGADYAVGFGGSSWMATALRDSGFVATHNLELTLRDRGHLIPEGTALHLSPFEADYAYT